MAGENDLPWTYLGGSRECIDVVLAEDQIEGAVTSINHKITLAGDTNYPRPS